LSVVAEGGTAAALGQMDIDISEAGEGWGEDEIIIDEGLVVKCVVVIRCDLLSVLVWYHCYYSCHYLYLNAVIQRVEKLDSVALFLLCHIGSKPVMHPNSFVHSRAI